MFILYIIFGIATGLVAAIVALLAGASFLTAFFAYALAGMVGMSLGLVWALSPKENKVAKQAVTQRS